MRSKWTHKDANSNPIINSVGGASTFISLTDAPSSYTGEALKVARVKADETGLEFATISGSGLSQQQVMTITSFKI